MTITVFLGYRNQVDHLLTNEPGHSLPDHFTDEVQEWCDLNLSGPAWPEYETFKRLDEQTNEIKHYGRHVFVFANERDVVLFKLFHIG